MISFDQLQEIANELKENASISQQAANKIVNNCWGNCVKVILPYEWARQITVYVENERGENYEMIFAHTGRYLRTRKAK